MYLISFISAESRHKKETVSQKQSVYISNFFQYSTFAKIVVIEFKLSVEGLI